MEHLKNIGAGAVGAAVICAALYGIWWFGENFPRAFIAAVATLFFTFAFWRLGRSLRSGHS
jgi:hypothetical protein